MVNHTAKNARHSKVKLLNLKKNSAIKKDAKITGICSESILFGVKRMKEKMNVFVTKLLLKFILF